MNLSVDPVTAAGGAAAAIKTVGDIIAGAKTANDAVKLGKELGLGGKLARLLNKKRRIIILGASGAGKTQFIESLKSILPDVIHRTSRTKYPTKRDFDLVEKFVITIVDTPGQEEHKDRRMKAIKRAMRDAHGVINVVSYGYHEPDIPPSEAITKKNKADPGFLGASRVLELDLVAEWASLLSGGIKKPWLLTVVTKADLWWDERNHVLSYYTKGDYFKALGPAKDMSPSVCLYSSVRQLFFGKAPVSGYFDDTTRFALRADFFRVLAEVLNSES